MISLEILKRRRGISERSQEMWSEISPKLCEKSSDFPVWVRFGHDVKRFRLRGPEAWMQLKDLKLISLEFREIS